MLSIFCGCEQSYFCGCNFSDVNYQIFAVVNYHIFSDMYYHIFADVNYHILWMSTNRMLNVFYYTVLWRNFVIFAGTSPNNDGACNKAGTIS